MFEDVVRLVISVWRWWRSGRDVAAIVPTGGRWRTRRSCTF